MARRKVVTTVSIDPDVFQIGRDDGFNFSQLLEQAIIDNQDPEKQVAYLRGQIKYHEDKAIELRKEVEIVEKAENRLKKILRRNAIDKYLPEYKKFGILNDEDEQKLCLSLKMTPEELTGFFDECIASE